MFNEWRKLNKGEALSLKKKREVRFHQQRESDKQWQHFKTEDE